MKRPFLILAALAAPAAAQIDTKDPLAGLEGRYTRAATPQDVLLLQQPTVIEYNRYIGTRSSVYQGELDARDRNARECTRDRRYCYLSKVDSHDATQLGYAKPGYVTPRDAYDRSTTASVTPLTRRSDNARQREQLRTLRDTSDRDNGKRGDPKLPY